MRRNVRWASGGVDAAYRAVTVRLGIALLTFLGLFIGLDALSSLVTGWLPDGISYAARYTAEELCDCVAYLLSFMLPVLVYDRMTPREASLAMPLSPKLPHRAPMIILASVAVIYTAAIANALLLNALGWSSAYGSGFHWVVGMPVYQGVLMLISTSMVPAFCEELLFRGTTLTALRPFGKTTAVLGSAVLFGLMHGNPSQLLYTTVAGVVLALATLESGSLWIAVLIHLFNNLLSVVEAVLFLRFEETTATLMYGVLELLVIGGGLLCLLYLVSHRDDGGQTEGELTVPRRPVRDFLTPPMLAFVLASLAQMLLILL